ncbi:MAG: lysophospholipid acyltransferase family protein [Candidatus Pacebacteria bacterium]|nr:lysophospholipid acyltransferase family protein [Candidatus Paceibacterota bacterium]
MNRFTSTFSYLFLSPILKLIFIKSIKGRENLPKTNFILTSNHQSYFDILACGIVCVPRRLTFIGQVDNHKGLSRAIVEFCYFLAETIHLNRNSEESKKQATEQAITMIKKGYVLSIYPEGKRSTTGEIQKGKWGAAKIFLETGVPIVPMGTKGAFELFPPKGKIKFKKIVELNIGKPLYFKEELEKAKILEKDSKEYENICIAITEKIMAEIKRLAYE